MEAASYLTKDGKDIFLKLEEHLKDAGVYEVDTFKLSALANAFDMHSRAASILNKSDNAFVQETKTGYSQVKAEFTVWQKSLDVINKFSPAFGIDIASREKILAFSQKKEELPDIN